MMMSRSTETKSIEYSDFQPHYICIGCKTVYKTRECYPNMENNPLAPPIPQRECIKCGDPRRKRIIQRNVWEVTTVRRWWGDKKPTYKLLREEIKEEHEV